MKALISFFYKLEYIKRQEKNDLMSAKLALQIRKILFFHYGELTKFYEFKREQLEVYGVLENEPKNMEQWLDVIPLKNLVTVREKMNEQDDTDKISESTWKEDYDFLQKCESSICELLKSNQDFSLSERRILTKLSSCPYLELFSELEAGQNFKAKDKQFYIREIHKAFIELSFSFFSGLMNKKSEVLNFYSSDLEGVFFEMKRQYQVFLETENHLYQTVFEIKNYCLNFFRSGCYLYGYAFLNESPNRLKNSIEAYLNFLKSLSFTDLDQNRAGFFYAESKWVNSKTKLTSSHLSQCSQLEIIHLFLNLYHCHVDSFSWKKTRLALSLPSCKGNGRWSDILNSLYLAIILKINQEEYCDKADLYSLFESAVKKIRDQKENSVLANSLALLADACSTKEGAFSMYSKTVTILPVFHLPALTQAQINFKIETDILSLNREPVLKYIHEAFGRTLMSTNLVKLRCAQFLNSALFELEMMSDSKERLEFFCVRYHFDFNASILTAHPMRRALFYIEQIFNITQEKFALCLNEDFYNQGGFGKMKNAIFNQIKGFSTEDVRLSIGS